MTAANTDEGLRIVQPWPRRDPAKLLKFKPPAKAVADYQAYRSKIQAADLPHPAELIAAAEAYLAGEPNPLGAAAIAANGTPLRWATKGKAWFAGAGWIAEHGAAFAAAAVTAVYTVPPAPTREADLGWLAAVRKALAAASDEEYAAAERLVEPFRTTPEAMAVAAALIPTRRDWFAEAIQHTTAHFGPAARVLYAAADTAEDLAAVAAILDREFEASAELIRVAAGTVGAAALPWLIELASDIDYLGATAKRPPAVRNALADLGSDEAFEWLIHKEANAKFNHPKRRAALERAITNYPRRAIRLLAESDLPDSWVAEVLAAHPDIHPAGLGINSAGLTRIEKLSNVVQRPETPEDQLPWVLVTPPWTQAPQTLPVIDVPVPDTFEVNPPDALQQRDPDVVRKRYSASLTAMRLRPAVLGTGLLDAPYDEALAVLRTRKPSYIDFRFLRLVLQRFQGDAVVALSAYLSQPQYAREIVPILHAEAAAIFAAALTKPQTRPDALAWLERHGLATVPLFVPSLLGNPGARRIQANQALHILVKVYGLEAVVNAAQADLAAALRAALTADPRWAIPAKVADAPTWIVPELLPPVLLPNGTALPNTAVRTFVQMLMLTTRDTPVYAGAQDVIDIADPDSLAEFSWAIFERWEEGDFPAKDAWVLPMLGILGDDEVARKLAAYVRIWPGQSRHQRAVAGLEALALMGTDVALSQIHGISQKAKFAGIKASANVLIEQVAARLDLSPEQLADRLVPDFGLDADGLLTLDFGPRQFTVEFDEMLKPVLRDQSGTIKKTLPKPGVKDDPVLAPAAAKQFAGLKKDTRAAAGLQVMRLERAMVLQRRWAPEEFDKFFKSHPLMWHLARRLVWAAYDGDQLSGSFRIAEDRTLADVNEEAYAIPAGAKIGIAHPLHLGAALAGWQEQFDDYEILQPFLQVRRRVFEMTPEELAANELTRFDGLKVPTGSLLGVEKRGWSLGQPEDAGIRGHISKDTPTGARIYATLDPGISATDVSRFPEQEFARVWIVGKTPVPLGTLDDVTRSELLMDLDDLTST